MIKRTGVLAAGLAMVLVVLVLRRAEPQPGAPAKKAGAAPPVATGAADTAAPPATGPRDQAGPPAAIPEAAFWGEVGSLLETRPSLGEQGHRTAVLEATSRYLGLDRSEAQGFAAVARQAALEIEHAWQIREQGWMAASSNATLTSELRERMEQELQELYEGRKGEAMARVETFLQGNPRSHRLRERLPEWMDALR